MSVTNSCENYAKTLTDSTFDFSITGEEIRGGSGNALWGKYFHDSNPVSYTHLTLPTR